MNSVKLKIVVLGLGVVFYSCEKKTITPVGSQGPIPVWEDSSKARTSGSESSDDNGDDEGQPVVDGITDPNSDPDGDKGSKTKKI